MPDGPSGAGTRQRSPERPWWGLGDVAIGVAAAQVLSVLVFAIVFAAAGWSSTADAPLWVTALLQIPLWCGLGGVVLWAADHKGNGLRSDFGFAMQARDAPLGLVVGVACQLVVLPALYWPVLEALDMTSDDLSAPAQELADRAGGGFGWAVLILMVVVGAPVVEELFYRGLVLRSLEKRGWPAWATVVGSAALFAAMHFEALQFLGLFVFALVLGALVRVTGRLGPAIWAHAGFNGATVLLLALS